MEQHPPSPGVGMNFPPPEHKAGPGHQGLGTTPAPSSHANGVRQGS